MWEQWLNMKRNKSWYPQHHALVYLKIYRPWNTTCISLRLTLPRRCWLRSLWRRHKEEFPRSWFSSCATSFARWTRYFVLRTRYNSQFDVLECQRFRSEGYNRNLSVNVFQTVAALFLKDTKWDSNSTTVTQAVGRERLFRWRHLTYTLYTGGRRDILARLDISHPMVD